MSADSSPETDTAHDSGPTFRSDSDDERPTREHGTWSADEHDRTAWKYPCQRCSFLVTESSRVCPDCGLEFPGGLGWGGYSAQGSDI